jgi:hypothetical protein
MRFLSDFNELTEYIVYLTSFLHAGHRPAVHIQGATLQQELPIPPIGTRGIISTAG